MEIKLAGAFGTAMIGKVKHHSLLSIPGEGWFLYDGKTDTWARSTFPDGSHECATQECADEATPQEAEPVKEYAYNGGPETDANHDFSEAMAAAFPLNPHNVQIGVNTGFVMLPETTAVRFLVQGNGLGEWVRHFLTKQQDYGDWAGELGAKGQFADMYRKWPKIRKAMWDGEPLVGEQLDEVLMDLIGHCFLSLMFLKREKGEFK